MDEPAIPTPPHTNHRVATPARLRSRNTKTEISHEEPMFQSFKFFTRIFTADTIVVIDVSNYDAVALPRCAAIGRLTISLFTKRSRLGDGNQSDERFKAVARPATLN